MSSQNEAQKRYFAKRKRVEMVMEQKDYEIVEKAAARAGKPVRTYCKEVLIREAKLDCE